MAAGGLPKPGGLAYSARKGVAVIAQRAGNAGAVDKRMGQAMDPAMWMWRRRAMVVLAGSLGIAGCDQMSPGTVVTADDTPEAAPALSVSEQDVERPELFAVAANGRWDGRPSLGGIWVAHPESAQPERVLIRRVDTDETVKGALFRRDRVVTGAPFQISSDAAEALEISMGEDVVIEVVAIRREVLAEPVAAAVDEPVNANEPTVAEDPASPAVVEPPVAVAPTAPAVPDADIDAIVAATAPDAEAPAVPVVDGPAAASTVADIVAATAPVATAVDSAGVPVLSPQPRPARGGTAPPEAAPPVDTAEPADPALVETRVATAGTGSVGPVFATVEPEQEAEPVPEPGATPVAPEPAAPAAPAPATARYVQVGTFGVRDNAEALVQLLRREGFDAVMRDTILNGREFSRVLVGPVVDPAILSRTLGDLRSRGFRDALEVRS